MLSRVLAKPATVAALVIGAFGLVACGESSSEKATKQICSATSEITSQIKKLSALPISSSFPAEAKTSVEAINKSIGKIKEAQPNLPTARQEELTAANNAFRAEIVTITKDVVSASKSSNLEAGLKSAEPQIRASLSKLASGYQKAFEALKCS